MDSSFASPVGKEIAAISAKQQLTVDRYLTDSRPIPHRQSTDTLATVDRNISAGCRPTYRPIVSTDGLLTKTTCQPTLGRYIGRVSVAISVDSINRHSVDRCLKYTWAEHSMLGYQFKPSDRSKLSWSIKEHRGMVEKLNVILKDF